MSARKPVSAQRAALGWFWWASAVARRARRDRQPDAAAPIRARHRSATSSSISSRYFAAGALVRAASLARRASGRDASRACSARRRHRDRAGRHEVGRDADWRDMVANALGVIAGARLSRIGLGNWMVVHRAAGCSRRLTIAAPMRHQADLPTRARRSAAAAGGPHAAALARRVRRAEAAARARQAAAQAHRSAASCIR